MDDQFNWIQEEILDSNSSLQTYLLDFSVKFLFLSEPNMNLYVAVNRTYHSEWSIIVCFFCKSIPRNRSQEEEWGPKKQENSLLFLFIFIALQPPFLLLLLLLKISTLHENQLSAANMNMNLMWSYSGFRIPTLKQFTQQFSLVFYHHKPDGQRFLCQATGIQKKKKKRKTTGH